MIKGVLCKDTLTKKLIHKLLKNQIAVICHKNIDLVAAQDLKYKKVKAIINCENTVDNSTICDGTKYLLENDIKIFDVNNKEFIDRIKDGDVACITNNKIYINGIFNTYCSPVLKNSIQSEKVNGICMDTMSLFFKNTVYYMSREIDYFLLNQKPPDIKCVIKDREVVIVARGRFYREDLKAIRNFIKLKKPVLIGVDGGAEALADIGFESDIIIGDMDSVSDSSLLKCGELLVHSYNNGYAPGANRLESLGLSYKTINIKGTSEDAALYLAKFKGASSIYMIGSHTGIEEFIEKGRYGMSSTVLLRILAGSDIIDLKGISSIMSCNNITTHFRICLTGVISIILIYILLSNNTLCMYIQSCLKLFFKAY